MTQMILLDGPMGTELAARGVSTEGARWSATAIDTAPEVIAAIHRDYADAGATVHTANTFRTKRRQIPDGWEALARRAVAIARGAVPAGHKVAGSIAPLEDCYRPDLSPGDVTRCREEHRELAEALAAAGVDVLLCETFPHVGEAWVAVEEAARTGLPTWVAFTAGPEGTLLSPEAIAAGAREAVRRGASAVLVNCTPAAVTERFVARLAGLEVPFGAYANAGSTRDGFGWDAGEPRAEAYAAIAARWAALGATILGGCCGTGPAHIRALARQWALPGEAVNQA